MSIDVAPHSMRPDRLIMATVFACSIVAGWAMLPGENERVAMLERDGHSREALAILEGEVAGGDKRYRTLNQVLALYEDEGDVAKARATLEDMVRERPRDPALRRRQAQFYKNNQHLAEYIAAMQDLIDIRYTEPACRELIAQLRFMGDGPAEQSAIQRCRQKGYRRPEDLSRLAELVAADGDGAQATAILKSIDDLKRLKTLRERFQLLSLLAEQDQPREAERRAMRWVRSAHDDTTAVSLIDHLARSTYPDSAYEVAKDAGVPGDGISLTVAERLIEKDQNGAALLYLRGWLERAKTADTDTAIRFVDSAIAVGAPELAIQGARQFGYVLLPQQSLLKLAAALEQSGATIEAGEVRRAVAGGAPVLPVAAAIGSAESRAQPVTGRSSARGAPLIESGSRQRSVVLVDPLDGWRRSLFTSMSSDAQRRMQALFVGPKRPSLHAGRHFGGHAHFRDLRAERHSGAKFLKKTSRVLLRTKKFKALRAKRLPNGEAKTKEQAVSPLDLLTPQPKTKPNGTQKP